MGYRSQVVLAITKELQPHFMAALSVCQEATVLVFKDADRFDRDYYGDGSGHWFIQWSGLKWYDSYEDIRTLENFVDAAESDNWSLGEEENENSSEHLRFVRIGEDAGDVECKGYAFEEIYPYNAINF